jgi:hypothetical protein
MSGPQIGMLIAVVLSLTPGTKRRPDTTKMAPTMSAATISRFRTGRRYTANEGPTMGLVSVRLT